LSPPLIVTPAELNRIAEVLGEAIREAA